MKKVKHHEQNIGASPQNDAPPEEKTTETPTAAAVPPQSGETVNVEATPAEATKPDPLLERLMRVQADFENFRKRVTRERAEFAQRAAEDVFRDLLPVLDHFELALAGAKEHGATSDLVQGIELIYDELIGVLAKHGLSILRAEVGQPFDPQLHEAIAHVPSEEIPEDAVIRTTRSGYRLGGKLLRPMQVLVSSGAPAAQN